jgi:hypothetical protein
MKAFAAALVFGLALWACDAADAQYPVYPAQVVVQPAPAYSAHAVPVQTYSAPVYSAYSVPVYATPVYATPVYASQRLGFLGRLMEFERRKNAWLRQTFFGRP